MTTSGPDFLRLAEHLEAGTPVVCATVVESRGSVPAGPGSCLLLTGSGPILGTVGGGPLESYVIKRAETLLGKQGAVIQRFALDRSQAGDLGMVCGGEVSILFKALAPDSEMARKLRLMAGGSIKDGPSGLVTTLSGKGDVFGSARMDPATPGENQEVAGLVEEMVQRAVRKRRPLLMADNGRARVAEPLIRPFSLLVFGAGHVGMEVARLADRTGFEVTLIDDRPDLLAPERLGACRGCLTRLDRAWEPVEADSDTFVVIVTRGHAHDREVLEEALRTRAPYVGMIGSRAKKRATYAELEERGIDRKSLERVHCPIGLSIGARTPAEIAVSIVAELIAERDKLHGEEP